LDVDNLYLEVYNVLASTFSKKRGVSMAVPISFYSLSFVDYSGEKASMRLAITDLSAGNVAAQAALLSTLNAAINAVTLMPESRTTVLFSDIVSGVAIPSDPDAQREKKWLVRYHDAVNGQKFSVEIPGSDLSLLSTAPQTDFMDSSLGAFTDLKTAFEAVVKSPNTVANAVIMDSLEYVGRKG
jgi:hypothetical protein